MANTHIRFGNDDSDYNISESDDDYTEKEKVLLHKVRNKRHEDTDSDDEVFGIGTESNEDDGNDSDIALSDVEGQDDENDLPDIRAWGKDKRKFYSTDFVDPDYGGFQGKSATLAELEEEEAKNLQKQLAQELDDGDFSLEMFVKNKEPESKEQLEEVVKTDISKLSKRQKLQLIKQESPEFFELIGDFQAKITLVKETLKPVLDLAKNNKIIASDAFDFVKFYHRLILNYTTNISMYLLLKASKVNLKHHPIIKRLFQYRQYLSQMDDVFEEVIKPQLEVLLNLEENVVNDPHKKKTLKLLRKIQGKLGTIDNQPTSQKTIEEIKTDNDEIKETKKQVRFAAEKPEVNDESSDSDELEQTADVEMEEENEKVQSIGEKRAITYQIAKNKGLTPHRKKEQRNPRVKHRNKFRKAKIRRKGAVRDVRKELSRYSGEISGIKASVTKSIKIRG